VTIPVYRQNSNILLQKKLHPVPMWESAVVTQPVKKDDERSRVHCGRSVRGTRSSLGLNKNSSTRAGSQGDTKIGNVGALSHGVGNSPVRLNREPSLVQNRKTPREERRHGN
jgi:hypothetical protein